MNYIQKNFAKFIKIYSKAQQIALFNNKIQGNMPQTPLTKLGLTSNRLIIFNKTALHGLQFFIYLLIYRCYVIGWSQWNSFEETKASPSG